MAMSLSSPAPITTIANPRLGAVAAILLAPDGRYLMQLRDDKPGVWDPGSWGCFGGSIDEGESAEEALRRELTEELDLRPAAAFRYFTQVAWDYGPWGHGVKLRCFFEVDMSGAELATVILREGQDMRLFTPQEVLREPLLTSYDSHALRMHIRTGLPR